MIDEVQNADGTWAQVCRSCGEYIEDVPQLFADYLCEDCEAKE